ncbi:GYD domain-containing protein [Cognatazoarcus halotolerans]|uniref:GYD domain-containing protein n=1 Tax=Cognatazoarcus halotolerans TaxID=2686016 RepID=UPI001356956E|nr:GYD domain-containing protein [Cognatazoarcus halotolerans]MCB1899770.1 GYD domain-containing protein [Rhodocyclaceae bacterium]
MLTYISLCSFTDQGLRNIRETIGRSDAVRELASKFGVKMTDIHWTQGQYDLVVTVEAPDEASATAFSLAVASGGNVRIQTMRAFTREEMAATLDKLG